MVIIASWQHRSSLQGDVDWSRVENPLTFEAKDTETIRPRPRTCVSKPRISKVSLKTSSKPRTFLKDPLLLANFFFSIVIVIAFYSPRIALARRNQRDRSVFDKKGIQVENFFCLIFSQKILYIWAFYHLLFLIYRPSRLDFPLERLFLLKNFAMVAT